MNRTDDPRLGSLHITKEEYHDQFSDQCMKDKIKGVGLIGFPCDIGVSRNGGRPGAVLGPSVVFQSLPNFGCLHNCELGIDMRSTGIKLVSFGSTDENLTDLEEAHTQLRQLVRDCLYSGLLPICIGGGNDQSWANGTGWIDYLRKKQNTGTTLHQKLGIINVDAHLDVRPLIPGPNSVLYAHSGSPFRQLIEFTKGKEDLLLVEFGSQGQQCSSIHVDYVKKNGGRIHWLSEMKDSKANTHDPFNCKAVHLLKSVLNECIDDGRRVFFSFDIDAIRSSDCPGVSCPSPVGLTAEEAIGMCYEAGMCKNVDLMDISEFNPKLESTQTVRLILNMIYHFLLGYSQR